MLPDFYMDRHEVTNARVHGGSCEAGGYANDSLWNVPVERDGRTLSREEARRLFVDRTGQPGPRRGREETFRAGRIRFPSAG